MDLAVKVVLPEFLAQRSAVYAQNLRRKCLVPLRIFHNGPQHRRLDFAHDELVDLGRLVAVQVLEIRPHRVFGKVTQQPVPALHGIFLANLFLLAALRLFRFVLG